MHRIIGVIFLVVGAFLLMNGHDLSRSFTSHVRELAVGSPGSKVTCYYLGGALGCAIGLVEFFRSEKK